MFNRRTLLACFFGLAFCTNAFAQEAGSDALPSWNDGHSKKSIIDFVARVTAQGGADFVPAPERIAVFDNDGTLWGEQPNLCSCNSSSIA